MIFATDRQGKATYISPLWEELTGQNQQQAMDFGWKSVLHLEDQDTVVNIVMKAVEEQCEFSVRYRLMCKDGRCIWVVAGAIPSIGPPDHTFLGFLGSITQIAENSDVNLKAYGSIGRFNPPPPHQDTLPRTILELVADHLIITHALVAELGNKRLLVSIQDALRITGMELGQAEVGNRDPGIFH